MAALFNVEELQTLFTELGEFTIWNSSEIVSEKTAFIEKSTFLDEYERYFRDLQEKGDVEGNWSRGIFSSIWTASTEMLYAMKVGEDRYLIKNLQPVVQLHSYFFSFSSIDGKLQPMVLAKDRVLWGLQFSYPQIYQDPKNREIVDVGFAKDYVNSVLFRKLTKWLRSHSAPVFFLTDGKKVPAPMRIGRSCFSWIDEYMPLKRRGMTLFKSKDEYD